MVLGSAPLPLPCPHTPWLLFARGRESAFCHEQRCSHLGKRLEFMLRFACGGICIFLLRAQHPAQAGVSGPQATSTVKCTRLFIAYTGPELWMFCPGEVHRASTRSSVPSLSVAWAWLASWVGLNSVQSSTFLSHSRGPEFLDGPWNVKTNEETLSVPSDTIWLSQGKQNGTFFMSSREDSGRAASGLAGSMSSVNVTGFLSLSLSLNLRWSPFLFFCLHLH